MSRSGRVLRTGSRGAAKTRVALRPLSDADLPLIEPWYAGAGLRRHVEEARLDAGRELLAITLADGEEPVGLVDRWASYPAAGWLTLGFLAIAEPQRGRGLGGEAVLALEEESRRDGLAHRFAAAVPLEAGRALYFWLRLGYRPLLQADLPWPAPRRDVIWMVRDTD